MEKISKLQRLILFTLLRDPKTDKPVFKDIPEDIDQQGLNQILYKCYFGCQKGSSSTRWNRARASLSRAYQRLEERGLIHKVNRRWQLSPGTSALPAYGFVFAFGEFIEFREPEERRKRINEARQERYWAQKEGLQTVNN